MQMPMNPNVCRTKCSWKRKSMVDLECVMHAIRPRLLSNYFFNLESLLSL